MPVTYRAAADGVPNVFVLLLEPDWSSAPVLSYSIASEQSEGLTGIEDRTPGHRAVRLRQRWFCTLDETDAAALREALAILGGTQVACPIWADAYNTPWLHAGQKVLSWSTAGLVSVETGAGPYTYANATPMLVGRLTQRPTIKPMGGKLWSVTLEVHEDSPYSLRIDPASGSTPTEFDFAEDWSNEIEDVSRDQLRTTELGQGRELGVAGANGTERWGQSAGFTLTRTEFAAFLRFWVGKRGSVDSFVVPAWGKPGTDTPTAPDEYTARFDADRLDVTFETPTLIETTVKIWQEVELSGEDPPPQSGPGRSQLYVFAWEGGSTIRLTPWEHSLSYSAQTYTPARVGKTQLRKTRQMMGDEADISIFAEEPNNPFALLLAGEAERKLSVTVADVTIDAAGAVATYSELISGEIRSVALDGDHLVGHLKGFGGMFERKIPPFQISQRCNFVVFSALCGVDPAGFQKTGPIGGTLPSDSVEFTPSSAPTGAYAEKYFAGGWLTVTGTDSAVNRRAVLDCSEAAGVWTLLLNRLLPANCSGQTATVRPGCDGNYTTHNDKFAAEDFGGFPFLPNFIATSEGSSTSTRVK